jgi:hypothetical protein
MIIPEYLTTKSKSPRHSQESESMRSGTNVTNRRYKGNLLRP